MAAKYTDAQRANDYRTVFGSPTGQQVLNDILVQGHLFDAIRHPDPIIAARGEGARSLALYIAQFVGLDLKFFMQRLNDIQE